MSDDQEQRDAPPEFGQDDDANKNDDSMFVSVSVPDTVDISLNGDDDEDNPFGEPQVREKTATNTTNTVESPFNNEPKPPEQQKPVSIVDTEEKDLFGGEFSGNNESPFGDAPKTSNVAPKPVTPVK